MLVTISICAHVSRWPFPRTAVNDCDKHKTHRGAANAAAAAAATCVGTNRRLCVGWAKWEVWVAVGQSYRDGRYRHICVYVLNVQHTTRVETLLRRIDN